MDYGMSFKEALAATEADLADFDEMMEPAQELLSLTRTAKQSAKTDQANNDMKSSAANSTQEFVKRAQSEGEKILKKIERTHASTLKVLNNTWTSNENFIGEFEEMQSSYKLVEQITVINWSYGHNAEQYLHSKLNQLRAVITKNAGYLNNWQNLPEDALIKLSGKNLDKELVSEMGAPSSIDTVNEFMGHLRTQFRGRKSEKNYRGELVNDLINQVRNFAKTKTSYSQDINAAERIAKSAQSTVESHMRSSDYSDEDKQQIIKLQRNLNRMLVTYANMIYFIYRLNVEYILNRRALIERLFEK